MNINNVKQTLTLGALLSASISLIGCGSSGGSEGTVVEDTPIVVSNRAPTLSISGPSSVVVGETVSLTVFIDDDDTQHVIQWSQIQGEAVDIDDLSQATISFVAPTVAELDSLRFSVTVDDGNNDAVSGEFAFSVALEEEFVELQSAWIMNTSSQRAPFILDSSGLGVLVNVLSVSEASIAGENYTVMQSDGIPNYNVIITQEILSQLTTRPRANTDFVVGEPTFSVGDRVSFGEDIGYASRNTCESNAGYGYWPPGPECPEQSSRTVYLPKEPDAAEQVCETGLGQVGFWVNGTSVYNWGDGQSYNNQGDWQNLAPVAEQYDVDICGGHAARGDYHHHFYSSCLANLVDDRGDGHSPIYGFAADGYPIYGPWEADGILAVSAWTVRDYDSVETGCEDGQRSCKLIDSYDLSQGVETTSNGPGFNTVVRTLSGNELVAENGYFREDYYWEPSLTAQGGVYLDQYNGHEDAERGYHYHITVMREGESLVPAFPYIIGDRFAGELQDNSAARCSTGNAGGPPQ